jgi:hypothetical protein
VIKYALTCEHDHPFEGWFGASTDYDDQRERGLVECPVCGSHAIEKQIMAPAVAGTKAQSTPDAAGQPTQAMMMEAMRRVRAHVEDNFDYVGDRFAQEARDIHDGRSEDRGIYGEATPKQVKDLVEDGVRVAALPPASPKKSEVN